MPSPVRSKTNIEEREHKTKYSSRTPRYETSKENIRSSHTRNSNERGRLDFNPPQNEITRLSPAHKIRESTFSALSPFTSSNRGGKSKRYSTVSDREHEAAKRAAWEATSKSRRRTEPPFRSRNSVGQNQVCCEYHFCFQRSRS
jgi:hypothetical protein